MNDRAGTALASPLLWLAIVLLVALALRAWGIQFGLPYAYHVDEPTYVSAALNLGAGVIGKQPNPTGFPNLLFGEYALYFLAGWLMGVFPSPGAFEQAYRADPSVFLLLSRLTSVLFGTANVLVIYWIGRTAGSRKAGLIAAGLLAVSFLHVRDSHFGVPDIAATFWVSLAILGCLASLRHKDWRILTAGAAAAGLAIATKWSMIWVALPLGLAAIWIAQDLRAASSSLQVFWKVGAGATIGLLCGILIGGFQLLIQPATYLEYALHEARAGDAGGFGFWQVDVVPGWVFYAETLGYGIGIIMVILAMLGLAARIVTAARRFDRTSYLLLAFPVIYFLVMGATRHYFARYALPLIPFMALFAAEGALVIAGKAGDRSWQIRRFMAASLLVAAFAVPFVASLRLGFLLTQTDTRTLAKVWIEQHIPAGAKIAVDWPTHGPPLATAAALAHKDGPNYDLTAIGGPGLARHPVDWYRANDYDYLVASSFIYQIPLVFAAQDQERNAFYAALPQTLNELQVFYPTGQAAEPAFIFDEIYGPAIGLWQRERPGPVLRIYQIPP